MAYAIMRLKKVKTAAVMNQMYDHHYREKVPDNVDPTLTEYNDALVRPEGNFMDAWNARKDQLEYYDTHEFRKNGVMAYDIVFEYSPEAASWVDKDAWKADNLKWLEETFGKENVLSCVFHYDEASYVETGAIHGHAVVIPVDEEGKINASKYTGDRLKFIHLQDTYAEAMKDHGLERGLRNSAAQHTDIKRFYAQLTNAIYGVPMPEQGKGEQPHDYVERIKDAWRTERAAHLKKIKDMEREVIEVKAQYKTDPQRDFEIKTLEQQVDGYVEREAELVREFGSMDNLVSEARAMQRINDFIESYPDERAASALSDDILNAIQWSEEKDRQKDKDRDRDMEKDGEMNKQEETL